MLQLLRRLCRPEDTFSKLVRACLHASWVCCMRCMALEVCKDAGHLPASRVHVSWLHSTALQTCAYASRCHAEL